LSAALLLLAGCAWAGGPPKLPPLNVVSGSPRLPGKFVWADLVTDDAAAARTFYSRLFNWDIRSYGGYLIAFNDDRPLAGLFQRARPAGSAAKPRWFGYLSVPDVSRAQTQITNAGGRILSAPEKVPKRGEQAVFADPEGAVFGVVKSSSGDPPDFLAEPGDWIWIQLLSRDARQAATFYRGVAGYEVVENTRENQVSDLVLTRDGYARATVRTLPVDKADYAPAWLPFVRVALVGEAVKRARELGGRVVVEPRPALLEGRLAVIADPTGAPIGLMEWDPQTGKGTP
jgi:predicted enzyme related to lactoylglutathione lyase